MWTIWILATALLGFCSLALQDGRFLSRGEKWSHRGVCLFVLIIMTVSYSATLYGLTKSGPYRGLPATALNDGESKTALIYFAVCTPSVRLLPLHCDHVRRP